MPDDLSELWTVDDARLHGTLDPPVAVDRSGHFEVNGMFVRKHGGPIRPDEEPDQQPARYVGLASRDSMTLTVELTTAQSLGPFVLERGQPRRLVKCL